MPGRAEGGRPCNGPGEATIGALFSDARRFLARGGIADPGFEARRLLEHLAGVDAARILTEPGRPVAEHHIASVRDALQRRAGGEPLHRILGWREFYGLRLFLSPETLEPRPDTETLVDAVLPFVRDRAAKNGACCILDLGTGTGAIALALLSQVEGMKAVGADISADALETAAANARSLGLESQFQPLRSHWFEQVSGRFALIVSNPPYISHGELPLLDPGVTRFDPPRALDGGADGLDAYRILASGSAGHLEGDGLLAVEIGHTQREEVTRLFEKQGFALREARRDFGGTDRVLVFSLPENAANA